jgi:hypothetical protein
MQCGLNANRRIGGITVEKIWLGKFCQKFLENGPNDIGRGPALTARAEAATFIFAPRPALGADSRRSLPIGGPRASRAHAQPLLLQLLRYAHKSLSIDANRIAEPVPCRCIGLANARISALRIRPATAVCYRYALA